MTRNLSIWNDLRPFRGIAKRHFTRSFTTADDVEVKGAEMKDGMLSIALEKIVPEAKKPRTINIS